MKPQSSSVSIPPVQTSAAPNRRDLLFASLAIAGAASLQAETPIACNLKALNAEERRAHKERSEKLLRAVKAEPLSNGYAIRFAPALWLEAAAWVELERKCCPFLEFQLESTAENAGVVLRLTGRPGVKEFLKTELMLEK